MLVAIVPILVAIAGALIFALGQGKLARVGEILLFAGVLWSVYVFSGKVVRLP